MDAALRIAETTSGRDRICRLVQYGSKVVSWMLEVEGARDDVVKKIKDLENSISTARKLFRLGKSIDNFRAALQTIHLTNPALRFLVTMVKISRGLYLLLDHLIWAARMNLVTIDNRFWGRLANRFWVLAIFLSLLRDLYELLVAVRLEQNRLSQYRVSSSSPSARELLSNVARNNQPLVVDLVKNSTDLWIPLSRLDLVYVPSALVGLLGVISSLAGLLVSYDQRWKLKFS